MKSFKILLFLLPFVSFSQSKEGYWDNIRTTNETVVVKSNEKKLVKTASFPEGTTEVVFRVTVLDDNQQLSSSLVSLLKSIPDPTGISQGSAGAVFLVSKIAGDDKCTFAVFTSEEDAQNFIKTNKPSKSSYTQETPVNKEAKLVPTSVSNLWFVFESENWMLNEKIALEVVPWVNNKLSRGWNSEAKKELLSVLEKQKVVGLLKKKDEYYALFLDAISQKFTFKEYKQLLQVERDNVLEIITEQSLKKSGEVEKFYTIIRDRSFDLYQKGKTNEAIEVITTEMIAKKRASYKDYGILGDYYLMSKQFTKAEEAFQNGLKLNPSEINFQLNLAHVYLFTDRLSEAKEIYKRYANQTLFTGVAWVEQVKTDFKKFEELRFPKQNYKKIIRMIE
jgi:tetratricopeptide (TPR) repeat protein